MSMFVFYRALSSVSVRTATPESFARNLTLATTDLVATTAPALTLDRGVKDATSLAAALQVCVCSCVCPCPCPTLCHHTWFQGLRCVHFRIVLDLLFHMCVRLNKVSQPDFSVSVGLIRAVRL